MQKLTENPYGRKLQGKSADSAGPRTGEAGKKTRWQALMVLQHKGREAEMYTGFDHVDAFTSNFKARQSKDLPLNKIDIGRAKWFADCIAHLQIPSFNTASTGVYTALEGQR